MFAFRKKLLSIATMAIVFGMARTAVSQSAIPDLLPAAEWQRIDKSVERSLAWLASQQQANGSFPTLPQGQPGVTSLCLMAFATHGHLPGEGPYGEKLNKALDYIVSRQKPSGLLAQVAPQGATISRNVVHEVGSTAAYNHALSALALSEVFAMSGSANLEKNQEAIEKAITATVTMQRWPKRRQQDEGGWRYVDQFRDGYDSDLSVSGWQLMFLRSAKNSGFEVPQESIEDAVAYIQRCYHPRLKTFVIMASDEDRRSRGMAGAGILALAHAGLHNSEEAIAAGDWLLKEGYAKYNESRAYRRFGWVDDRYHYGVFCASQAMYQLGGHYWTDFYPSTVRVILDNQSKKGTWAAESHSADRKFGPHYTTALMTMTLGTPNQLLPIFQR